MTPDPSSVVLPWYRHRWPWILMAGPALVVVAAAVTIFIAVRSNDGLVADDYYRQGLAINQQTARSQKAAMLGLQAELRQRDAAIALSLRGFAGEAPKLLRLRLSHPTRAGNDQLLTLRMQPAGDYRGELAAPLTGRWLVALEDEAGEWRLVGDWSPAAQPVLSLPGGGGPAPTRR